jgi:hypothetical protein
MLFLSWSEWASGGGNANRREANSSLAWASTLGVRWQFAEIWLVICREIWIELGIVSKFVRLVILATYRQPHKE